MAHVLAKHASIREDQARQAAVVTRVVTDMGNDPRSHRPLRSQNQADDGELFPRPRIRADAIASSISARAPFRFPTARARFLTSMGRNAELKSGKDLTRSARQDFLSSTRNAGARGERAGDRQQYTSPASGERDRETYLSAIDKTSSTAKTRAKIRPGPAHSCIPSSAHVQPPLKTHAGKIPRSRDRGAEAAPRRCVRCGKGAGGPIARRLSQFRLEWRVSTRRQPRICRSTASRRHPLSARGDHAVQGLRAALRQRRLPLIFATKKRPPRATARP